VCHFLYPLPAFGSRDVLLQCERVACVQPYLADSNVVGTLTTCAYIPVQACPGGVSGAPVPFTVLQESVGLPEDILKRVIHSLACGTYFRVQLRGCLVRRECCVALLYCLSGTMLFLDAFSVLRLRHCGCACSREPFLLRARTTVCL
jgi:hypothetical protein